MLEKATWRLQLHHTQVEESTISLQYKFEEIAKLQTDIYETVDINIGMVYSLIRRILSQKIK